MKVVDGLLSKTLHLQWGWFVFIGAAVLILLSTKKVKEVN